MTPTTETKLVKFFEKQIQSRLSDWETLLLAGDLNAMELDLRQSLQQLYVETMKVILKEVGRSPALKVRLEELGSSLGMSQLKLHDNRIQIGTGQWVSYRSYYACEVKQKGVGVNRQLSQVYWGCVDRASPVYLGLVSMLSVICPSFELAKQVLKEQGIGANNKRIRRLSTQAGGISTRLGIAGQLEEGEDMSGLRVVVELDGGRSRMRENTGKRSKKNYQRYKTPWREPKLIAIHVLNEKGELDYTIRKPLYKASIQDGKACMEDLVKMLKVLKVDQAKEVQFLADGASFIWKRIRRAFTKAGVEAKKITYTLDYYHAVQHLAELSELLPLGKPERKKQLEEWKTWLWEGLANSIVRAFKKQIVQTNLELDDSMKTALAYFTKHHDRMQYKKFKRRKLLCGSGLVESAIRRVINLRFKGPSAFWYAQNLDKMLTLRCAFLAGRWANLLKNIQIYIKQGGTI